MLPVGQALAEFDPVLVSWIAVPFIEGSGHFTLTITVLVWRSTGKQIRTQIYRALRRYFTKEVLWAIVEEQLNEKLPEISDVCLRTRVINYRGDR